MLDCPKASSPNELEEETYNKSICIAFCLHSKETGPIIPLLLFPLVLRWAVDIPAAHSLLDRPIRLDPAQPKAQPKPRQWSNSINIPSIPFSSHPEFPTKRSPITNLKWNHFIRLTAVRGVLGVWWVHSISAWYIIIELENIMPIQLLHSIPLFAPSALRRNEHLNMRHDLRYSWWQYNESI